MMSQRRREGERFTRSLHDRGLHRIHVRWRHWTAKKGDPNGEIVASPQWPAPFGPPIHRATTLDDEVVVRPCDERDRLKWLQALSCLAAWDGFCVADHLGHRQWVKVPDGRETKGRFVVYESIEGREVPIYQLAAIDSGHVELTDLVANVIKSSFDAIADFQAAQAVRTKEAELRVGFGGTHVMPVHRTPEQQEWRANAEAQIKEVERAAYHSRFSTYQFDPSKEVEGVRHPAGFIIRDRRSNPQSGLAEPA